MTASSECMTLWGVFAHGVANLVDLWGLQLTFCWYFHLLHRTGLAFWKDSARAANLSQFTRRTGPPGRGHPYRCKLEKKKKKEIYSISSGVAKLEWWKKKCACKVRKEAARGKDKWTSGESNEEQTESSMTGRGQKVPATRRSCLRCKRQHTMTLH